MNGAKELEKMKTIFKLLTILALVFTVSACSKTSNEENEKGNEEMTGQVYETYPRGEWVEGYYTNEFVGISFTIPENWVNASDAELISMIESTDENFDVEEVETFEEAMATATMFYDLAIFDLATSENVMLTIEDLEKTEGGMLIDEDAYLDLLVERLKSDEENAFTEVGRTDEKLGEENYRVLELRVQDVVIQKFYVRKEGKYMIGFILSYSDIARDGTDQILAEINK